MSTDDEVSRETIDQADLGLEVTSIIPGGSRLSIFQSMGQKSSMHLKVTPQKLSESITTVSGEPEAEQGLLSTLRLDEQHESWAF